MGLLSDYCGLSGTLSNELHLTLFDSPLGPADGNMNLAGYTRLAGHFCRAKNLSLYVYFGVYIVKLGNYFSRFNHLSIFDCLETTYLSFLLLL